MSFATLAGSEVGNRAQHDNLEERLRIGIDNALGIHPQALQLRAERTEVLARNIANADTPGYQARDMDFKAVLAAQTTGKGAGSANTVHRTHAQHLHDQQASLSAPALQYRLPLMPSLDGNTVESQVEQAEFAQNALQFQASFRFLNGKFSGLMSAIKGE